MLALTVLQPWAWAIAERHKPIENRTWELPLRVRGQRVAIHAGKKTPDSEDVDWIARTFGLELPEEYDCGAILATAQLVRSSGDRAVLRAFVGEPGMLWHIDGCVGFVLQDVRKLREPVECSGQLGFWTVRPELEQRVIALGG